MNVTVTNTNIRQGLDVLRLIQAFRGAGIAPGGWIGPLTNLTQADVAVYAHTDMVPIKIAGNVYPVMENAAATTGLLAGNLMEWGSEMGVELSLPTIVILSSLLNKWQAHDTVRVRAMQNEPGWVEVSSQYGNPEQAPIEVLLLALAAAGLWNEQTSRIQQEDAYYIPA